ncbi:MAG: hypothetical protein ACREQ9_21340, partial [Candidatus Binatia bacterium]
MPKEPRARAKDVQAKVTAIGRPLRMELVLDGAWLNRLKVILRNMEPDGGSYPLQRYLEELVEADIVYREAISSRGPFLSRPEIMLWLQRRHAGQAQRK